MEQQTVTVAATVNAPVSKVWTYWTSPEHITLWNSASEDWHTPSAANDLRPGGAFTSRMEAKDGSMGFDFSGIYDDVQHGQLISYTLEDGRKVKITFAANGDTTAITETFDAEQQNPVAMQQAGWQAILDHFKSYTETH